MIYLQDTGHLDENQWGVHTCIEVLQHEGLGLGSLGCKDVFGRDRA